MVPLGIMLAGTLVLATAFRGELPGEGKPPATPEKPAAAVVLTLALAISHGR